MSWRLEFGWKLLLLLIFDTNIESLFSEFWEAGETGGIEGEGLGIYFNLSFEIFKVCVCSGYPFYLFLIYWSKITFISSYWFEVFIFNSSASFEFKSLFNF